MARPALLALAVFLAGSATAGNDSDLPPVAAAYHTQVQEGKRKQISDWRIWRSRDRVHKEWPADRAAEVWQRDGATLFRTVLFHEERRGIEFEQADLQMTGSTETWTQQAQVVSPALLQSLQAGRHGRKGDVPWQDYRGERDGVRWHVRMRTDLMIPLLVEQRAGKRLLRITLMEAHALPQAPWQPESAEGYGILDFADLGDHERDPFVLRAQARLGIGHDHDHE